MRERDAGARRRTGKRISRKVAKKRKDFYLSLRIQKKSVPARPVAGTLFYRRQARMPVLRGAMFKRARRDVASEACRKTFPRGR